LKDFYLFGKGELAIYCAEKYLSKYDKNNLKIIPVVPEPSWSNSLIEWSKKNKVEVIEYEKIINFNIAQESIGLSVYFDKIFKLSLIEKFYRLCNIHNSPLPKYRGVNPINWALKNGESSHGVTLHIIDKGVDTGDILDQKIFDINDSMEVIDVYNLCIENAKVLIDKHLFNLNNIQPTPQNNEEMSLYTKADFENLGNRKYFNRENKNKD
tara:strand:+ start:1670 stop:2302 length:633 start_codon:yes stop_codon:yes gene_type:complete